MHPQHFECLSGRLVHLPHWHRRFCQGSFDVISQDVVFWGKAMKRNILPSAITSTKEICFQKKCDCKFCFFFLELRLCRMPKSQPNYKPSPLHDPYCISLSWQKKTMKKNIQLINFPRLFPFWVSATGKVFLNSFSSSQLKL